MNFILPISPSINRTYGISESRMYKRRDVRSWEWEAGWEIKKQKKGMTMITGKIRMGIEFFYFRERDIDSGLKVLLDLFQKQRIYLNDKQIVQLVVIKHKDTKRPRVEVSIEELKGGEYHEEKS